MNNRLQQTLLALGNQFLKSSWVGPLAVAVGRVGFLAHSAHAVKCSANGFDSVRGMGNLAAAIGGDCGKAPFKTINGWGLEPEQREQTGRAFQQTQGHPSLHQKAE